MSPRARHAELFAPGEFCSRALDAADPLRRLRERFHIPRGKSGREAVYLCGNSLGLQPRAARALVEQELDDWAKLGVKGHFEASSPWFSYHESFRESGANLVGALPGEVVMMNGLTVNLHLMLASFYRPEGARDKILIEDSAFPSDRYAVASHLRSRGRDPRKALIAAAPRSGESLLRTEDVERIIEREGARIATVLLGGVNFLTGQVLDIPRITAAARGRGCKVGWDLAHAAGNIPLSLHDWDVDFAAWCSYKYLNSGPGSVAGCFVHERHGAKASLPRLAGWWGNDPKTRFALPRDFVPRAGADGWQLSNPPILSLAPLKASLELFDEAGWPALREKSLHLTDYALYLLDRIEGEGFELLTPREPSSRGCQLSLRLMANPRKVLAALETADVVGDLREPDVLRVAPVPLYNSFEDVRRFAAALARACRR